MTDETTLRLPRELDLAVRAELDAWRAGDTAKRLWSRDASLWTGADEVSWLGVAGEQLARASALREQVRTPLEPNIFMQYFFDRARCVPSHHLRRRGRPAGTRAPIFLWRDEGVSGPRRSPGAASAGAGRSGCLSEPT